MRSICISFVLKFKPLFTLFIHIIAYQASEDANKRGNHGWDNLNSEMQALFVAQGPSFQKSLQVRPFHNIELYNLMCIMIGIDPLPNNGTWVYY